MPRHAEGLQVQQAFAIGDVGHSPCIPDLGHIDFPNQMSKAPKAVRGLKVVCCNDQSRREEKQNV